MATGEVRRKRQLLRQLESHYPGISEEYLRGCSSSGLVDEPEEEEGASRELPARVLLRQIDAVPELFEYQEDLATQFEAVCSASPPGNCGLLTLPTGAGKTRTAAVALLRMFTRDDARFVLWLAPTRELLEQASGTFQAMWRTYRAAADLELVRADLLRRFPKNVQRGVLFATPQMIAARLRREVTPDADIVVFDEAHHVEAPVFRRAVGQLRAMRQAAVIGLSATPGRSKEEETERLVDFFNGRLLYSKHLAPEPIAVLQRRGVLARLRFREIPGSTAPSLVGVGRSMRELSLNIERFRALMELVCKLSRKARVLVFAASIDHARLLAAGLRRLGVTAEVVSSEDRDEDRSAKLRDFERGELSALLNVKLLATGYDCPAIRHVVLGTQIRSAIMFEQIVGRASRGPMVGGHARSTVWQFEDHLASHGLPQSYYRYSDFDWSNS